MSGFSADWLSLREPVDARARNAQVRDAVAVYMKGRSHLDILDLGSGTGSTLRALQPHLAAVQRWRLVDNDANLLARAIALLSSADTSFETIPFDFSRTVEPLFEGVTDLITASALFDLVSREWLTDVTHSIATRLLPVYIALSYDGRVRLDPVDPLDETILRLFNRHQTIDKGFGPALGPEAAGQAVSLFKRSGYHVVQGSSDWIATGADRDFQTELLSGWASAAETFGALEPAMIHEWFDRRKRTIDAGRLTVTVGHIDFFACPDMR